MYIVGSLSDIKAAENNKHYSRNREGIPETGNRETAGWLCPKVTKPTYQHL